jgi:hypothetical protein
VMLYVGKNGGLQVKVMRESDEAPEGASN